MLVDSVEAARKSLVFWQSTRSNTSEFTPARIKAEIEASTKRIASAERDLAEAVKNGFHPLRFAPQSLGQTGQGTGQYSRRLHETPRLMWKDCGGV